MNFPNFRYDCMEMNSLTYCRGAHFLKAMHQAGAQNKSLILNTAVFVKYDLIQHVTLFSRETPGKTEMVGTTDHEQSDRD